MPEEPVDYIHRIGRTGHAGEMGWALTIVTDQDVEEFYDIEALMGKTADLFDAEGLDLGENPPFVDPDRVPAAKPAGKKAKKRRRAKAEGSQRKRPSRDRRDARAADEAPQASERRVPRDKAVEETAKPSRRKRSGKTRVRADKAPREQRAESGSRPRREGDRRSERPARDGRNRAERRAERFGSDDDRSRETRRDERPARDSRRGGGKRDDRGSRSGRGGNRYDRSEHTTRNGEEVRSSPRNPRDSWRNFDEPSERRDRRGGSRGGRAGGRDNRGSYNGRGGSNSRGGSRRPRRSQQAVAGVGAANRRGPHGIRMFSQGIRRFGGGCLSALGSRLRALALAGLLARGPAGARRPVAPPRPHRVP